MSQFGVMKNVAARLRTELQAEAAILDKKYGLAAVASDDASGGGPKDPLAALEAEGSGLPVVRPGDASVAAPFTSRVPSVRSVVHLIRQGRCTLLSSLQQQQIMMLECTISAYTYAAISLEGARSSERQMMVSGWLVMAASLSFSYSTPLDRMHPVRPLRSLFHPAVFLSIFGQALIHLYSMSVAVKMATSTMGPEKIAEVVEFNKRVQAGLEVDQPDDEDPLKMLTAIWHRPFLPNLMNTTVFLVETAQIMAVLFVNYKGRPFMKGLLENHALFLSLFICIGGVAFASWEVLPEFNRALHFYPFPDDAYRWAVMKQIFLVVGGTFIWDRVVTAIFTAETLDARKARRNLGTSSFDWSSQIARMPSHQSHSAQPFEVQFNTP
jgi:cation-transporting ATPase 13A1